MQFTSLNYNISEGAFSIKNDEGNQVLCIFEELDDVERYVMHLNEAGKFPKMEYYEVDKNIIIEACELHGYEYVIISKDDIVIPPFLFEDDYF
jgi:hypothetical protein